MIKKINVFFNGLKIHYLQSKLFFNYRVKTHCLSLESGALNK